MKYTGEKVLIIGGTSGLGLALARDLKRRDALVTITTRNISTVEKETKEEFEILPLDITNQESVDSLPVDFKIVFCCAGFSIPSLAIEIEMEKTEAMVNCNFLGPVRIYRKFLKSVTPANRKSLVLISSTLGLHSFTGYGTYSPTKAALSSFFESVYDESDILGLDMYIYYVSTITSRGFHEEQKIKSEITKKIEGSSVSKAASPENRARRLLDEIPKRRIIYSDFITRLFSKSTEIHTVADVLSYLIAPFFWILFKVYAAHTTRKYYVRRHFKQE